MEIQINFVKISKTLFNDEKYKSLKGNAKSMLIHLIYSCNSFRSVNIYQTSDKLKDYLKLTNRQITECKKELRDFGVKIYRKGNYWWYDLNEIMAKYTEYESGYTNWD